ncbi:UDP-N-acetylmuramate dehydrogenase [Patescibacteria group bacterium]|jgi:UDP-N-acetylmuramate dehydrogenase|nr:UDP-N-acetylmuramate dehydrogenase [Patescibacteria group bacterium]
MENFKQNVSLREYSTMRLGGNAAYLTEVEDEEALKNAVAAARALNLPIIMIGKGSNIIWRDEGYPGLVLVNRIRGFSVKDDEFGSYVTIGSGEIWDEAVAKTVELGLTGIECLSLIPGTAGATPVQNVGAYGQEIAQTLVTLSAYDSQTNHLVTLAALDCGFSYRNSIFKTSAKGRYFITSITLMLSKASPLPPFYPAVSNYLATHGITQYTPAALRQAVTDIRRAKLPDPNTIANSGSFFYNPIVDSNVLSTLEERYPAVPHWDADNGQVKLSAAWLIAQTGFANYYDQVTGIATWPTQALVFVNQSANQTAGLLQFAQQVKTKVAQQFGVELMMEPQLLP